MRIDRLLILLMFIALVLRIFLCFQPAEVLIPKAASDDMFYYLSIARNIAEGYGATTDRENATNGFHPLWAILLVPVFKLVHDGSELQWALCLLTLFSVLTAWFIYKILRVSCGEMPSFVAAVLWLCCPYTVLVALAGVEAPLFALVAAVASYCYLRLKLREVHEGALLPRWISLGIVMGAAVLARVDGALLAVVIFADSLIGKKRSSVPVGTRLLQSCSYGAACALVILPWCVWSYLRTGFVFQTSGRAIYHQQHAVFRAQYGNAGAFPYAIGWLANVLSNMQGAFRSVMALCGVPVFAFSTLIALCLFMLIAIAVANRPLFHAWRERIAAFNFLFCYGLLIFLLYCAYLWYSQDWYYYSMVFVACILGGCFFDLLDQWLHSGHVRFLRVPLWTAFLLCAICFCSYQSSLWWKNGIRGWQIDMYRAALWVKENVPKDARIGSFNSGILAYYCPQTVINLDGVANGAAFRAVTEGKIFSYVRGQKIGYIVEPPLSLRFRSFQCAGDPPPGLKPLHAEGSYPEALRRNNPVIVYEVIR